MAIFLRTTFVSALLFIAGVTHAADIPLQGQTFAGLVDQLAGFVDKYIIPLLFIIAFVAFLIGMVRYFFSLDSENRQHGRAFALWGIVGLVVLFTMWGIVNLFVAALK
jgi:hypothetical protein